MVLVCDKRIIQITSSQPVILLKRQKGRPGKPAIGYGVQDKQGGSHKGRIED
jgi:hypothetical protein